MSTADRLMSLSNMVEAEFNRLNKQINQLQAELDVEMQNLQDMTDFRDHWKIRAEEAEKAVKLSAGYLSSIMLSHPHLVPHEILPNGKLRLTIYDTEQEVVCFWTKSEWGINVWATQCGEDHAMEEDMDDGKCQLCERTVILERS